MPRTSVRFATARHRSAARRAPPRRAGFSVATLLLASVAAAVVTTTAAVPARAAPVDVTSVPEGAAFYDVPADQIAGPHGSVIQARSITGAPGIPGARNLLVLYRSVDPQGHPVAVSGTVAVPDAPPPPDGWPLVSWAHGTTGVADDCAPSLDTGPGYPAHDYTAAVRAVQQRWVEAGYAVAQTDYQGLGTPGPHGYLIGDAEARAVTDIALAARQLDGSIGTRWVAIGHSQGGQAAMFAGAGAHTWAPELDLRGAVALAPISQTAVEIGAQRVAGPIGAAAALPDALTPSNALLPLLIRGAQTAANIDPARFLTPRALAMLPEADSGCLGALRSPGSWGDLPTGAVFTPTGDVSAFMRVLADNDPSTLHTGAPLLVAQGGADATVDPVATRAMVDRLHSAAQPVDYRTYSAADHRGILDASFADTLTWVNARFDR